MADWAVGSVLSPIIDTSAFADRRHPFPVLDDGAAGFPGATVAVDADATKRWPMPIITSMTVLQSWTLLAWRRSRIDLSASTGMLAPSAIGINLMLRPDKQTRFRFGLVHSDRLAVNAYAEKSHGEQTFGVGLQQSTSDDRVDELPRATLSWSGVLVPKSTIASANVFLGINGPGYTWSVLSTPQGDDGFRLRVAMNGDAGSAPRPLLAMSYPIGGDNRRLYTRLRLDSAEVGLSLEPVASTTINFGLESSATGLALRFRCQYRFFTLSVPIRIDQDARELRTVAFCIAIPMMLWGLWRTLPLLAARRHHLARQQRMTTYRDMAVKIEQLRQRRLVALDQQQAMRPEADARRRTEQGRSGLVIESATFFVVGVDPERGGRALSHGPEFSSEIDVCIPLQFWVEDSRLTLSTAPKRSMLGFYCPFGPSIEKTQLLLRVEYSFNGAWYACDVSECEPLNLPDPRHLLP